MLRCVIDKLQRKKVQELGSAVQILCAPNFPLHVGYSPSLGDHKLLNCSCECVCFYVRAQQQANEVSRVFSQHMLMIRKYSKWTTAYTQRETIELHLRKRVKEQRGGCSGRGCGVMSSPTHIVD